MWSKRRLPMRTWRRHLRAPHRRVGQRRVEGLPPDTQLTPPVRRVGSPFATDRRITRLPHLASRVTRGLTSERGAVAACVLGILGLLACFVAPLAAVLLAAVGLSLGIRGLFSQRRGPAIVGILFCSLAVLVGSLLGAVSWYESRYGYLPWDAPGVVDDVTGWGDDGVTR
jgi:hypothetical protein